MTEEYVDILTPAQTVTGVYIRTYAASLSQRCGIGGTLVADSGCCGVAIIWQDLNPVCSSCKKKFLVDLDRPPLASISGDVRDTEYLEEWVSYWTGLAEEEFVLEVKL